MAESRLGSGITVQTRREQVRTNTPLERLARWLPGTGPRMLVDAVPVDGKPRAVLAAGAALTFEATAGGYIGRDGMGQRVELQDGLDPLAALWTVIDAIPATGVPAALRSVFGFMSYEAARGFERLPGRHPRLVPDYQFFLPALCVTIGDGVADVVSHGLTGRAADDALRRGVQAIQRGGDATPGDQSPRITGAQASLSPAEYGRAVERAKQYLRDGDIFQVVLALHQRLTARVDPWWLYRRLATTSSGPFQFCYAGPRFAAVGVSPEPFVTVTGDVARLRPLAGTRPRGSTPEQDQSLEHELRTSEKELAEHRMLVDLARNDLGRICVPGTVAVDELLHLERYAHVMHLESNVVGRLPEGTPRGEVIRAAFPAGTMTGAPKVRAMQIVDELEPQARGLYSGLVGLLASDEIHTYLTIRSAHVDAEAVTLSAGAGIVYDSEPAAEYAECLTKLRTVSQVLVDQTE